MREVKPEHSSGARTAALGNHYRLGESVVADIFVIFVVLGFFYLVGRALQMGAAAIGIDLF